MKDGYYAWSKLHVAVLTLAGGSGDLQTRLREAYSSALIRLHNPAHQFPWPVLRQRFGDVMAELAPNGRIEVALSNWSPRDLCRIAESIVALYDAVAREIGPE